MNSRNLGRFAVDGMILRSKPGKVAEMFAAMKLVAVRAEHDFESLNMQYIAISELFDEVPVGAPVPEYDLFVEEKDGKLVKVTVKKREGSRG